MARLHFIFRPPGYQRLNEPPRVVLPPRVEIRTTVEDAPHHWSDAEVSSLSQINDSDFDAARAWLVNLGLTQAVEAFDA